MYCYSDNKQLHLLTKVKPRGLGTVTGYLDATDTVVRKVNSNAKNVLYFANK